MSTPIKIRRALLSVYDKTGLVDFARALHEEFGIELISTGGTARTLKDAGLPVTLVEEVTGFPELMDGRVKTLHPKIHAAILADRDNPEHMRQLKEQGIEPIDMVVVNLYPFEKTIAKPGCTVEEAIEMIDIGGPCLLRAAAKNHRHVLVVSGWEHYVFVLSWLRVGQLDEHRTELAVETFSHTAGYDGVIEAFLDMVQRAGQVRDPLAQNVVRSLLFALEVLRYGENAHQRARRYRQPFWSATERWREIGGVEMSYNNHVDASAALELCAELTRAGGELWHRFSTGDSGMWHRFVTGGSGENNPVDEPVADERLTRRNLPHIQRPEAIYFVTFRLRTGQLAAEERDVVLSACRFWHGRKMTLHAVCVMPDHVHLLLTPHEIQPDEWISLGELLHSIKRFSAREINKAREGTGALWLDESFDRIIRNEQEFREKWEYIEANPVTAGLVGNPGEYRWFWRSDAGFGEILDGEGHRLETGATVQEDHRLKTGATRFISTCCFIKHTNACGTAVDLDRQEAYRKAYLGDPNAAMGGILAVNFNVEADFAEAVMETYQRWGKNAGAGGFFVEVWVAPSFDEQAVEVIRTKKKWGRRVRLLNVGDMNIAPDASEMDLKRIAGGVLMQTRDLVGLDEEQWKIATERQPTEAERDDLRLAWLVCKHTKSNAISICKDGMLIGNGAGQMSRVMSCRIATWLAQDNGHEAQLEGAVAASDGFFPFRDGPDILVDAGITALIQPGGSKKDQQVIEACNQSGVAMAFTGTRHFKH